MKTASGPMERWYPMEVLAPEQGTATLGRSFLEVGENKQGAGQLSYILTNSFAPPTGGTVTRPPCLELPQLTEQIGGVRHFLGLFRLRQRLRKVARRYVSVESLAKVYAKREKTEELQREVTPVLMAS